VSAEVWAAITAIGALLVLFGVGLAVADVALWLAARIRGEHRWRGPLNDIAVILASVGLALVLGGTLLPGLVS
jgi:uncharacterized membrane protein YidH (DUF202 family)